MDAPKDGLTTQPLSLPDELVLMLLNEQTGYFHQVPGWELNCTVVGAALAELSLLSRIDTDMESLHLLDATPTGNPTLDPILRQIADEPVQRNAGYWIERLTVHAESIIDLTLDRLVDLKILEYHDGEFWTLAPVRWHTDSYGTSVEDTVGELIKTRITRVLFFDAIPHPRDIIVVCLVNTCDVFRYIFDIDEETEERIAAICRMDLIGRSIAEAISHNLAGPMLRRSTLTKRIPAVSLPRLLLNPHLRTGNIPALFADLANEYGPVFQVRAPFRKPMTFLAGPQTNRWVNKRGRMHLRAWDYFVPFQNTYGASGVLSSLDGTDHFRLRKAMSPAYSRARLEGQLDRLYRHARTFMADWTVGDRFQATSTFRRMVNAQTSSLALDVESQDLIDDLIAHKSRVLNVHVLKILPKFLSNTPAMKRREKSVLTLMERVQSTHTPAQRAGCPRNLADDLLGLNASDPVLVPESNLPFGLSAHLLTSMYIGDAISFVLYAMVTRPALHDKIRSEADALFADGDPAAEELTPSAIDVTHRFLMECLRMYPIVPAAIRDVMNACVVEGYELPVGSRLYIAQAATHYMPDVFPDPFSFDIDRYLPPRNEQQGSGYAAFGLGTHRCLGSRWLELQLAVNVLMLAHYFSFEVSPANYKFRISPFPSMKPSRKLHFRVAELRHELPV